MIGKMDFRERAKAILKDHRAASVHDWLTVMGGAEEVARDMFEVFPTPIFCGQFNAERMKWAQNAEVHPHWISNLPYSKTKHYYYAPVLADVYRSIDLREFDLVATASHTFAHNVSVREDAVHCGYYHSVARSLWLPEIDGRAGSGFVRSMIVKRLKRLDLIGAKNFTYIAVNSETTKARVEKFYRRPVDRVVYPGVNVGKFADVSRKSDQAGFTMWSRLIPYKKFDLAIAAAIQGGFKLNIVGAGPEESKLKELAAGHANIKFHGRLPDDELKRLLSESQGVLFPAYEDFGIVPVEAMAAGLPVIVYREGGAAETVRPEFGEHISAQNPEEIVAAVNRIESRTFDESVLKAHASGFSTERFQREWVECIEAALERGPKRHFIE